MTIINAESRFGRAGKQAPGLRRMAPAALDAPRRYPTLAPAVKRPEWHHSDPYDEDQPSLIWHGVALVILGALLCLLFGVV